MQKIDLVIFDWAGTLVDFGCRAPLEAFIGAFAAMELPITEATARRPMGAHKRDHVLEILTYPEVAENAAEKYPKLAAEELTDKLYDEFTVRLLAVLPQFAEPIPGAIETLAFLRSRGVRIGSTTGYTRPMMNVLEPLSRAAGVVVDALICADEVPQGRPAPWACLRLAEQFSLSSTSRALKVGDTPADMGEGVNAGMLAIGLTVSGNEVGQSLSAWNALPPTEQAATVRIADERLRAAGAAHTLPSVAELPALLEQLNLI